MTFEEWWNIFRTTERMEPDASAAWNYQQEKIDKLESNLTYLGNEYIELKRRMEQIISNRELGQEYIIQLHKEIEILKNKLDLARQTLSYIATDTGFIDEYENKHKFNVADAAKTLKEIK